MFAACVRCPHRNVDSVAVRAGRSYLTIMTRSLAAGAILTVLASTCCAWADPPPASCAVPPKNPSRADEFNVLGTALKDCSRTNRAGYSRSGRCSTGSDDLGVHVVCAQVTSEFLSYSRRQGNDLTTPRPDHDFPGLKPGDRWCLCVSRWKEALAAGVAPPVLTEATHAKALEAVTADQLAKNALSWSPAK